MVACVIVASVEVAVVVVVSVDVACAMDSLLATDLRWPAWRAGHWPPTGRAGGGSAAEAATTKLEHEAMLGCEGIGCGDGKKLSADNDKANNNNKRTVPGCHRGLWDFLRRFQVVSVVVILIPFGQTKCSPQQGKQRRLYGHRFRCHRPWLVSGQQH